MEEPVSSFTYVCTVVVCFVLILYIFSDYFDRFHERLPRRVTWLDMLGGYVLLLVMKFLVDGFIQAGPCTGTMYSFPVLISDCVMGSSVLDTPYEYPSLFITNAFVGFILCLGFAYVLFTQLLKLPSVGEIPYTGDTVVSRLFGFHPLRLRIPIMIVLVSSILFSVVYSVSSLYEIGYIDTSIEDTVIIEKAVDYLDLANSLFYLLISSFALIILNAVIIIPELLLETIFQFSINLNTGYFDKFVRGSQDTVLLVSMGIIYVAPVIGRSMVSRFKSINNDG